MTYRVDTAKSAEKEFEKLPTDAQIAFLRHSFSTLLASPFHLPDNINVKKLTDFASTYRIRVGNYRMIYVINKKSQVVTVIGYDARSDAYKDEDAIRDKEKRLLKAASTTKFQLDHLGQHHGQDDYTLSYVEDGRNLGQVEFAIYDDIVHIDYIRAHVKGRGIGKALMEHLIEKYGWKNIDPGMQTDEGAALVRRLVREHGPHYQEVSEDTVDADFALDLVLPHHGKLEAVDPGPTRGTVEIYAYFHNMKDVAAFLQDVKKRFDLVHAPSIQRTSNGAAWVLVIVPEVAPCTASIVKAPMDQRTVGQLLAWQGMREVGTHVDALKTQLNAWIMDVEHHPWLWVYDGGDANVVAKHLHSAMAALEKGDLQKADAAVETAFSATSAKTAMYDVRGDIFGPTAWQRPLPSELAPKVHEPESLVNAILDKYPMLKQYMTGVKVVMEKQDKGPEARTVGTTIHIYPKYWLLGMDAQDFVFAHEVGHVMMGRISTMTLIDTAKDYGVDVWDTDDLPFSAINMEEAFCDAFATFVLDPTHLRHRYPKWMDIIKDLV